MKHLRLYEDFNIDYSIKQFDEDKFDRDGVFRLEAKFKNELIGYIEYIFLDRNVLEGAPFDSTTNLFLKEIRNIMSRSKSNIYCDIITLWVKDDYRGKNIAKTLMNKTLKKCKSLGIHDIFLYAKPYIKDKGRNINFDVNRLMDWYSREFGFKKDIEKEVLGGFLMHSRI